MTIIRISYGFRSMTPPQLADHGTNITTNIAGLPAVYPSPAPTLLVVNNAISELGTAIYNARFHDRLMIQIREDKEVVLQNLLMLLGAYCISASEGNTTALKAAGWNLIEGGSPLPLVPPTGLAVSYMKGVSGSLQLDWKRVPGATYLVQVTDENLAVPTQWHYVGGTSRCRKYIVPNLIPGTVYSFRIFAVKGDELSGASSVVSCMAV